MEPDSIDIPMPESADSVDRDERRDVDSRLSTRSPRPTASKTSSRSRFRQLHDSFDYSWRSSQRLDSMARFELG